MAIKYEDKFSILTVACAVMILHQEALAVEQFDLLPCTEGGASMLYCIENDSVGGVAYLHDNITRRMTITLPQVVLTQLWLNHGEIVIMTPSGQVINNGQELVRPDDRDRWTLKITFQHVNSDVGRLQIDLYITYVSYIDEQILHVEIRTADNIFRTRGKPWITITNYEGETTTTGSRPRSPSAIPQAITEIQQNTEGLFLQEENMAEKNHYRNMLHGLEVVIDVKRMNIITLTIVLLLLLLFVRMSFKSTISGSILFRDKKAGSSMQGEEATLSKKEGGNKGKDGLDIADGCSCGTPGEQEPFTAIEEESEDHSPPLPRIHFSIGHKK